MQTAAACLSTPDLAIADAFEPVPNSIKAVTVLVAKAEQLSYLTSETPLQSVLTGRPNACTVGAENMSSGSALPTALAAPTLAAAPPASAFPPALGTANGSGTGLLLAAAALTAKGSPLAAAGALEPDRVLKGSAAADGAGAGSREPPKGSAEALPVVLPKRSAPAAAELLPKGAGALADRPELPKGSEAPKPDEAWVGAWLGVKFDHMSPPPAHRTGICVWQKVQNQQAGGQAASGQPHHLSRADQNSIARDHGECW